MIVVPVVLGTTGAVTLLLTFVDVTDPRDRIELLKTGFTIGAGTGGVAALVLAGRRQWSTEQANKSTERDAAERRITELYTKAADQLGSDKAAVRLAGLYALERLAQNDPEQRQTIVNVLCAYLRMPFDPLPEHSHGRNRPLPHRMKPGRPPSRPEAAQHDPREELLVRKTAQRIIVSHLFVTGLDTDWPRLSTLSDPKFWPGIELDLSGATLIDFEFVGRRVELANFIGARFIGGANFAHAEFDGHAYFHDARFEGGSGHFFGAWFGLRVVYTRADFGSHEANFEGATFCGIVFLRDAKFGGGVNLDAARSLADFNTSWGSSRQWPIGWVERSLSSGEQMPRARGGRWARSNNDQPDDGKWTLIVRDKSELS